MTGQSQTDVRASFARETISVSTTAIGVTSATAFPAGDQPADWGLFSVETNDIRYTTDGTTPTNAVGIKATAGSNFIVYGTHDLKLLKMIRVSADASVQVNYARIGDR